MTRPLAVLFACLFLVALAGCGDDENQAAAEATATATATPEDTGGEQGTGCEPAEKAAPKQMKLKKPKQELDPSKTYVATVATNCGDFKIELDAKRAPKTGGSFKHLVDEGLYDGLGFHRIVPGFVIQGGDPAGNGSGGPGYSVVEAPPENLAYTKGVVAMAKTQMEDPGTSGSQFFVVTGEDAQLPPEYALLGKVTEGQDVVDLIGVAPVGADEQPVDPIVIQKVTIDEG
ncbi:MAG TPA: peptidylprolyl isomerase [Solirubrobacteraceae bacterium]|nr:peptidylprolyl isomerase [Solirubrobacteraceae bacterium]